MLDKLDKVDRSEVVRLLVEQVGLMRGRPNGAWRSPPSGAADESFVEQVRALGVTSDSWTPGSRSCVR